MLILLFTLLVSSVSEAKPDPNQRFPKQFVKLLKKGGWTPTPTNSGRYQVGDVFDFAGNKKILAGNECFASLPEPAPMADINITNMLKSGLTIPFGVFKGKAKGKRYKKSTFANTEVLELTEMAMETGMNGKCRAFLRKKLVKTPSLQLIKAIIQSQVKEQECTGKEVGFGFQKVQLGAENYEQCAQDSRVQVTIAYQLIAVKDIEGLAVGNSSAAASRSTSKPRVTPRETVSICRCLREPGNSAYMRTNKQACNVAISKKLGVSNWETINMSKNRAMGRQFDAMVKACGITTKVDPVLAKVINALEGAVKKYLSGGRQLTVAGGKAYFLPDGRCVYAHKRGWTITGRSYTVNGRKVTCKIVQSSGIRQTPKSFSLAINVKGGNAEDFSIQK